MRRGLSIALGLVAASLLTACGSTAPSGSAARSGSAAPSGSGAADMGAPTCAGTGPRFARNEGAWDLVLRDVRVGKHEGFGRVVVEFEGTGTPGWSIRYVRTPRADGSGEVMDVRGAHVLGISISGVTLRRGYPRTPEDYFHGPRHFAPRDGGDIEDVHIGGVFEGYSQLFLGVEGERVPFRVFALTNPTRLVIDACPAGRASARPAQG